MEQWEYITRFVQAEAKKKETKNFIKDNFDKKARRHSPESMIPELNEMGEEGWEIIHMEPVPRVGGKENIRFDSGNWSNTYFVVAKRRKPGTAMPVVAIRQATPTQTPPTQAQNVPPAAPSPEPKTEE